jgi:hypothetical protein
MYFKYKEEKVRRNEMCQCCPPPSIPETVEEIAEPLLERNLIQSLNGVVPDIAIDQVLDSFPMEFVNMYKDIVRDELTIKMSRRN